MSKKVLTSLDFSKNQILNVALQNLATAPSSPVVGQIYYNTADARVYFWDSAAWIDMSGDIQDVLGGAGLTASTSGNGDVITLDVNVDNVTIEISSDTLRIKDLGVSTAKLADSAVTTVKINANAVTFAKLQQLATMTVVGNVTGGTANAAEVSVITDGTLATASNTNIPTSTAVKTYVDAQIGALGNLEGGWDASVGTFPVGSSPVVGTKKGDAILGKALKDVARCKGSNRKNFEEAVRMHHIMQQMTAFVNNRDVKYTRYSNFNEEVYQDKNGVSVRVIDDIADGVSKPCYMNPHHNPGFSTTEDETTGCVTGTPTNQNPSHIESSLPKNLLKA